MKKQIFSYTFIAGFVTVIDWLLFTVLFNLGLNPMFSHSCGRLMGGATSFWLNKSIAFKDQEHGSFTTQVRRFILLYIFSFSVSLATLYGQLYWLHLSAYFAKLNSDILCFIVNFCVMKLYVFYCRPGISHLIKNKVLNRT